MTDYRSLEHKIRDVMIAENNRNTEIRRKVSNVGRPDDNVKDETSKLAKQGEIKTKIIDEASDQQTDGAFMKDKDKPTKKKPDAQDEDDPREIKGGKTEVDLKPTTNDSTEDTNKEDEVSKKAKNKVNKEIGAKGVKEEMIKSHFGLPESLINAVRSVVEAKVCPKCGHNPCQCEGDPKEVEEELKGNQKKLDKNHNGKLDKQDFKMLRKEEVELSAEELARLEEINNNLDEVVTARKLTAADKAARAKYYAGYKDKLAHAKQNSVTADPKSFKQRNSEPGDYTKQPSQMHKTGLLNVLTKQDTKVN